MILRMLRLISALLGDRKGGTVLFVALGAPVVIGAAGIGVETGLWYMTRRHAQTAADAAAVAGAMQLLRGAAGNMTSAAVTDATRNGFPNTAPSSVAVNR